VICARAEIGVIKYCIFQLGFILCAGARETLNSFKNWIFPPKIEKLMVPSEGTPQALSNEW
jgi:hypothetical protein